MILATQQDQLSGRHQVIGAWVIDFARGKWRLYEAWKDGDDRISKGRCVRRFDPEAGDREGLPAAFETMEAAVGYAKRWIDIGLAGIG